MATVKKNSNLIWLDLEMTGLDIMHDHIIEIATVVTDKDLNMLAEGPVLAIHQSEKILAAMDEWNTKQHGKSGLIERIRQSKVTKARAEKETLAFLEEYVPAGKSPMCGNSICQDRRFLARLMPKLEAFFHYRNLDVSTVKELGKRWYPKIMELYKKQTKHTALSDVYDSIEELKFYREHLFK
ncbi:MAG: oligoribonuclease [Gammaproteobacteria bacterium RIFCSPHIGHO2_02_FULL_42_13]|nr:MAG: oligoribonuclease [Gammaproteobacteria bacterium RIFCSPHIGHO2_02_FULL_42_13]OGT67702.1 MAG: oligoribonuclease [Gammaproteobacteria bacterium RIFCSPLOWO2_02_FULL_42_9]